MSRLDKNLNTAGIIFGIVLLSLVITQLTLK